MASEQRTSKRVVFSKGFDANMMAIDGTWRRGCILKDVSQSGARLIMLDTIEGLPLKEFFWCFLPAVWLGLMAMRSVQFPGGG
jgi:hypothetical protein